MMKKNINLLCFLIGSAMLVDGQSDEGKNNYFRYSIH